MASRKEGKQKIFFLHTFWRWYRCSLQSLDLVSSSIVNKRASPHRCYSFQMIPERKRVLNLNSEKNKHYKTNKPHQRLSLVWILQNTPIFWKCWCSYQINIYVNETWCTSVTHFWNKKGLFSCWGGSTTAMRPPAEQI